MKLFSTDRIDARRIARRRITFLSSVFMLTGFATWFMADLLWRGGLDGIEIALLVLFVILFAHIATGFCMALIGFFVLNRGGDSSAIGSTVDWAAGRPPLASTAVVVPVANEDVSRVFESLRVIYLSLQESGRLEHFDFFVLSDSNQPNQWIQEEVAWVELCKQVGGFGRIFYRKRRQAINRKSGNVADFLRRWGRNYRYMVVLDADSLMTGESLTRLVGLMERNPGVGIIQTAPRIVNGVTLYARLQQFANRLYSPLFLAGLNYWQQHDGNYWGHNAIIRVQPFMSYCCLPDLPGREPFGGRILSHDFVEAALMRKGGWQVWIAADLEGSYEEGPPTLIDNAKRDRRWCQGNMQHSWLLFARGFRPVSRLHLLFGIMGYVASPLWLLFLLLSSINVINTLAHGGFTVLPEAYTSVFGYIVEVPEALTLFAFTMLLLFLPKALGVIVALRDRESAAAFGGSLRLVASAILETAASTLAAPIQMLFNSKFVIFTLLGQGILWINQRRGVDDDDDTDWREAILTHASHTAIGLVWGISAFILTPQFFWWLSPVLLPLMLSIPLSIILSKSGLGRAAQRVGLFLTPEETRPPEELTALRKNLAECYRQLRPLEPLRADYGLLQAVLDPYINAVHVSLLRQRRPSEESREYFMHLRQRLLAQGPAELSVREKMALLIDADSMIWLHRELWRLPAGALAGWWRLAMRQYNVLTTTPVTALYR